ncbi:NADH dehydrogenase, FAD-containing subunit [Thiovulum sp. ES]|nr:NADH dehydrogenase, FAD-containing subunit [Thiovulum sp. ES]
MKKLRKNIVVLGGGFAGVESAIELGKERNFNVTLVSNRPYLYVYPTSIWVPVGKSTFADVTVPLNKIAKNRNFNFVEDSVSEIFGTENYVTLESGKQLEFDYLIVAMGADKLKSEGSENTLSICGEPEESLDIQKKLDLLIAKGSGKIAMGFGANPKDKSAVRGGPAFELMFNVHNRLKNEGIRDQFELTFFAPMPVPGARMGDKPVETMNMMFDMINMKKRFGKKIKRFEADRVVFEDDSELESDLIVYVSALTGHKTVVNSDLPVDESGFIEVNEFCEVKGFDNVYAVGDIAKLTGPEWKAKQGHIAEVMARNSARNIVIKENDLPFQKESYIHHLNILCVMDSGDGAGFLLRDDKRQIFVPLPIIGHWLKRGWGLYAKWSKLGYIPRIPGM